MIGQSRNSKAIPAERFGEKAQLIIGSTPGSDWERILPLLERAGYKVPEAAALERWKAAASNGTLRSGSVVAELNPSIMGQALKTAAEELLDACAPPAVIAGAGDGNDLLDFWLTAFPRVRLLLFHARPEDALVRAMLDGQEPSEMLTYWETAAERLLQTWRRNRNRVSLMDVDCVLSEPGLFLHTCKALFGLNLWPFNGERGETQTAAAVDMYRLIASQMVAQSPRVVELIVELEACSTPLGEPPARMPVDCGKIYRDYQAQQAEIDRLIQERDSSYEGLREIESRLEAAGKEGALARLELQQIREELEAVYLDRQRLVQRSGEQAVERERLEERLIELTRARDELSRLASEREAQFIKVDQAHQKLDSDYKDATQENELRMLQLHQIQEELESSHVRLQAVNEKLQARGQDLRSIRERFRATNSSLQRTERKLKGVERRLHYLEKSRSWRMTAPLRALRKRFARRTLAARTETA